MSLSVQHPSKDDIFIIIRKHTRPANDKYHGLPYYFTRIQRRNRYVKLRWFDQHFPDHEVIVEIDNPNSIHAFNRFEEEGHAERKDNHFRLIGLTREELYAMGYLVSLMMRMRRNKFFSQNVFVSGDQIQKFFDLKRTTNKKMSSLLNVSNGSSRKSEEFSPKDIEVLLDSKEQNWFKRTHIGKCLGLSQTEKLLVGLDKCEIRVRKDFDPTYTTATG